MCSTLYISYMLFIYLFIYLVYVVRRSQQSIKDNVVIVSRFRSIKIKIDTFETITPIVHSFIDCAYYFVYLNRIKRIVISYTRKIVSFNLFRNLHPSSKVSLLYVYCKISKITISISPW